jgi:protein-tyrosine phosphatase
MSGLKDSAKRRVEAVRAPVRRVLMVCMGNICRSPTAEAVLRHRLQRAGLVGIEVDSAGTHAGHIGHQPDDRAIAHAGRRGYDLAHLQARRVRSDDFEAFDLVVSMDDDNLAALQQICPPEAAHKLVLLLDFAPGADQLQVPDPYYGGPAGFERVLDLVELGCDGLLQYLQLQQGSEGSPESPRTPIIE